jgi:hypothetical protein
LLLPRFFPPQTTWLRRAWAQRESSVAGAWIESTFPKTLPLLDNPACRAPFSCFPFCSIEREARPVCVRVRACLRRAHAAAPSCPSFFVLCTPTRREARPIVCKKKKKNTPTRSRGFEAARSQTAHISLARAHTQKRNRRRDRPDATPPTNPPTPPTAHPPPSCAGIPKRSAAACSSPGAPGFGLVHALDAPSHHPVFSLFLQPWKARRRPPGRRSAGQTS